MPECKLDSSLLSQCDQVLSKCGRPQAPAGQAYIEIDYPILFNGVCPANGSSVATREVNAPAEWRLRDISVIQSSNVFVRIQAPNGRFLSNYLMDAAPNAWAGSYRRAVTSDLVCQPGQKFRITLDSTNTGTGAANVAILFGGVIRFAVNSNTPAAGSMADRMPRYWRNPNTNLLAPQLMLDREFQEVPAGMVESEFRISTLPITGSILTPGGQTTLSLPLNSRYSWQIRRLTFEQAFAAGVTGTLSVIPRDSSGFSLTTDYVPVSLLQFMPWAHLWEVAGGETIFLDFRLANTTGSGAVTFSANAIGSRRRAA